MPYDPSPRDAKVRRFLEANRYQQFGQVGDYSAFDGATGCTHVCWQKIAQLWTGKKYTIDQISKFAGYYRERNEDGVIRGMNAGEAQRLVNTLNLPYAIKFDMPWEEIWERIDKGPVLYAVRYGSEPDWRGYVYNGHRADGSPNGFARQAGRTQLTGFENGAHAVVGAAKIAMRSSTGNLVRTDLFRVDPNHGSGSRPEKPPYDIISSAQGKKEYNDYRDRLGRRLMAWVPTKSLPA